MAGDSWTLREIGGRSFVQKAACSRCHSDDGVADALEGLASTRTAEWITGHVADPEMIAPGLREAPTAVHEREAAAMVASARRASRQPYPGFPEPVETSGAIYARYCVGCHKIEGDGGTEGPDLTHVGSEHDVATLRRWIVDPELVDPEAEMPSFGDRLSDAQLDAIAGYLAARK